MSKPYVKIEISNNDCCARRKKDKDEQDGLSSQNVWKKFCKGFRCCIKCQIISASSSLSDVRPTTINK